MKRHSGIPANSSRPCPPRPPGLRRRRSHLAGPDRSGLDLLLVSGDEQSAEPGDDLPAPLVVRVVDAEGNPVAAAAVSWLVGGGGGIVSPGTAQTDSEGLATARLTLGETAGLNTVNAVVSGLDAVTFTASANGGTFGADHLEFLLQPNVAFTGERMTPPVIVAVVDANGEVVRDLKVKIEIVLAAGTGTLDGKREQDTKDGVATFEDLRLDETVSARCSGPSRRGGFHRRRGQRPVRGARVGRRGRRRRTRDGYAEIGRRYRRCQERLRGGARLEASTAAKDPVAFAGHPGTRNGGREAPGRRREPDGAREAWGGAEPRGWPFWH